MLMSSPSIRRAGPIRPPSVAGSFYPSERRVLASMADGLLAEAEWLSPEADPVIGTVVGLLVPHAGLVYSGVVAAAGWRHLGPMGDRSRPDETRGRTVVLLGTNHGARWLDGVAVWDEGAWRTPLGDVAVDADLAGEIVELGTPFLVDHDAHRGEHSIEVQLPLLQAADPDSPDRPFVGGGGHGGCGDRGRLASRGVAGATSCRGRIHRGRDQLGYGALPRGRDEHSCHCRAAP